MAAPPLVLPLLVLISSPSGGRADLQLLCCGQIKRDKESIREAGASLAAASPSSIGINKEFDQELVEAAMPPHAGVLETIPGAGRRRDCAGFHRWRPLLPESRSGRPTSCTHKLSEPHAPCNRAALPSPVNYKPRRSSMACRGFPSDDGELRRDEEG